MSYVIAIAGATGSVGREILNILDERKFEPNDILLFNCSGRGDKDLETYIDYFKL